MWQVWGENPFFLQIVFVYLHLRTYRTILFVQDWTVIEHRCCGSFLKCKNISQNYVSIQDWRWGWYHQPIRSSKSFRLTARIITFESLGANGMATFLHKCTPVRFFCEVNNILNELTRFLIDPLAVIYCLAMCSWIYFTFFEWENAIQW